jgi:thiamine transport system ATP-binding protein
VSGLLVDSVRVAFGSTTAVDNVTLDVRPGEVVALLGHSGCGKSTLLRVVAGLEVPAAGRVCWDGTDLAPVPVHRRGFGLMFQEGQLFAHRDVGGNVAFGLRMAGMARSARQARVAELLELVGLPGTSRRALSTLSGGEQQRVALARALAPSPRLLLLDEPLSSLDSALRERLTAELAGIVRATGTTAVYVTHDHDEAFTVADRVAVMDAGRLLQVAEPAVLWRSPADERVARFLGYRDFVTASAVGLPGEQVVGLRADSLVVDGDGALEARVRSVRFTRGGTTLTVDLPGVGSVEARAAGAADVPVGAVVRLRLEAAAVATLLEQA